MRPDLFTDTTKMGAICKLFKYGNDNDFAWRVIHYFFEEECQLKLEGIIGNKMSKIKCWPISGNCIDNSFSATFRKEDLARTLLYTMCYHLAHDSHYSHAHD